MRHQTKIKNALKFAGMFFFCLGIFIGVTYNSHAQEKKDPWERTPRPLSLNGKIEEPANGSVPRHFPVKGTIKGQFRHLWIVERIGELHWPKEPALSPKSGKWQGEVFEGGWPPEGRFELLLVDISDETNKDFRQWLSDGHQTGNYPGLTLDKLGSVIILDQKRYQLLKK